MKQLFLVLILSGAVLSACNHEDHVYLQGCAYCNGHATPVDLQYRGDTARRGYTYTQKICFRDDTFPPKDRLPKLTDFSDDKFLDTTAFTYSTFSGSVDFSRDTFSQAVYFDDVIFARNSQFAFVRFPHYAKFTNLQLTDSVILKFDEAILPDTLDFSQNPALKCKIDLTVANFDEPDREETSSGDFKRPHYIFLYNSDISKFKLDYFHFRLLLADSTITPSHGTKHQRITQDQQEAMYEALLINFKQNGQEESYKRLDIEYQQYQWKHSWFCWLAWLPRAWWYYGYNKWYVFIWIIASLSVFSFINSFCLPKLNDEVYLVFKPGVIKDNDGYGRTLWRSIIYTGNIFFRLTLEREGMKFERFWPTFYFFIVYVLGVLCLGYLANFILQH